MNTLTKAAQATTAPLTLAACLVTLLLVSACGDLDEDHTPLPGATTQSACKPSTKADGLTAGRVKAEANGSTVTIMHEDAHYNCAAKLQLLVTTSGVDILAREVIKNPNDVARCMCDYDLSVPVSNLAPGTYKVTVKDADGKVAGTTSVKVGGGSVLVTNSTQSACKKTPPAATTYSSGAVKVTVTGGGNVTILHEDAFYNCAHKLKLTASLSGSVITAQEVIVNPKDAAFCMCHYDLSATVKNLPAGSYTVKVLDADGKKVDTVTISVP